VEILVYQYFSVKLLVNSFVSHLCIINIAVVISVEAVRENIVNLVEEAPTSGKVLE